MTTGERRPRKFRETWNLWHVAAFALLPAAAGVAFWSIETQGGTRFRVFMTVAQVLALLSIVCLMRGHKRKLAAAAVRSADGNSSIPNGISRLPLRRYFHVRLAGVEAVPYAGTDGRLDAERPGDPGIRSTHAALSRWRFRPG